MLTQTAQVGDLIVFAEISRMARSTLQVLEILECYMQIERELISMRTKEARNAFALLDDN